MHAVVRPNRRWVLPISIVAACGLASIGLATSAEPAGAAGATYVVTATGDEPDAAPGDGVCLTLGGTCTLRAAVTEDQRDGGATTITFEIPGPGVHTISIASSLALTDTSGGTTIDGYSQPGSASNTAASVSNAVLSVEIMGTGASGPEGFFIQSAQNVIRGLAIFNVRHTVRVEGSDAHDNVVAGNFLGTDASGTFHYTTQSSNASGVTIRSTASRSRVGGPALADRNVISGNGERGVIIGLPVPLEPDTNDNVVQNNLIGLTPDGLNRLPNMSHGIDINGGAKRNVVKDNVVSGNNAEGVEVSHGFDTTDNKVLGNRIGTDPTGSTGPTYARNVQTNVVVEDGPVATLIYGNVIGNSATGGVRVNGLGTGPTGTRIESNRIGLSSSGAPISNGPYGVLIASGATDSVVTHNTIAFNALGVAVTQTGTLPTIRNTISVNAIYGNSRPGIDLPPMGTYNPNDPGDADVGPNQLLNWPEITSARSTSVSGTACAGCRVELFLADATADPRVRLTYGQGQSYFGAAIATSDGRFTIRVAASDRDRIVTSTATDPTGNTSEFSSNALIPHAK